MEAFPVVTNSNICFFFRYGGTAKQALVYFGIHAREDDVTPRTKMRHESRFWKLFINLRSKKFFSQPTADGPYYTIRGEHAFGSAQTLPSACSA